jgi:digeranylgeranylglycerophospholipid reductase
MSIGDTVPTIDPLWGEGIHKGMKSARAAAITADKCLTPDPPDTSAEAMSAYDDRWHERVAPNARSRLLMTHLMYMADNDRYDRFMQDIRKLGRETLAKANAGRKRAIMKLLHLDDLPTLARLARRGIGG